MVRRIVTCLQISGFDLTFQKWFVSFPNENNSKTDLKFCTPWSLDEENFEIHQICNLLKKTFIRKNCIKQLCKESFEKNYVKFNIHAEKDHICFYKTSTNQTFTFISSKVVYCKSIWNIKYSTLRKRSLHCHWMLCIFARQLNLQ